MRNRTSDSPCAAAQVATEPYTRRQHASIAVADLKKSVDEFLLDCELRQLAKNTIVGYKNQFKHLFWFFGHEEIDSIGTSELKRFLHYLQQPPAEGGRWGNVHLTRPMRPQTAKDYHTGLRRLFNWMVTEDIVMFNPMQRVPAPVVRTGLKQALRPEQVQAMIDAARRSSHAERNTAIVLFLFDTGLRASELCNLRIADMDFSCRQAKIVGKGNKIRMCYWGIVAAKALSRYLRRGDHIGSDPVFAAVGGTGVGGPLTPQGLYKIIRELGKDAGVKCGCHDWRRTFAVNILKNGANLISVQRLMGHETLAITQGYLNIAQTDIEEQHRQFSPADTMTINRSRK